MIQMFKEFDGNMSEDSIAATVYQTWHYFYVRSLFKDYIKLDTLKLTMSSSYSFQDFA